VPYWCELAFTHVARSTHPPLQGFNCLNNSLHVHAYRLDSILVHFLQILYLANLSDLVSPVFNDMVESKRSFTFGLIASPGLNWPVPLLLKQHSVYVPGPGKRPAPTAKMVDLQDESAVGEAKKTN
jgi:hypothetical protein